MAENPITVALPADLPEDWARGQIIAPSGMEAGLSEQHGYNYLMAQVNAAQTAVGELGAAFGALAVRELLAPVTLASDGWSSEGTQTVSVPGVSGGSETEQLLVPVPAAQDAADYYSAGIQAVRAEEDAVIFRAMRAPERALQVYLIIFSLGGVSDDL